jgi:hypothetical protein
MTKSLKRDNNALLEKNSHFTRLLDEKETCIQDLTAKMKDLEVF